VSGSQKKIDRVELVLGDHRADLRVAAQRSGKQEFDR
jgi:hypothetical protein